MCKIGIVLFMLFTAVQTAFSSTTLEPAGTAFTTGHDQRPDVDYYGSELVPLPRRPVIEIIPIKGDSHFNPESDERSDLQWQQKDIGRTLTFIGHNVKYRGYRNSGWGRDPNDPAGAYLRYSFLPGENGIEELKPGQYVLKAQFAYIRDTLTKGKCTVNGEYVGSWDRPHTNANTCNTFISRPFTYSPYENDGSLTIQFDNLGGDRLRLSYVAIMPYKSADITDSETVKLENDSQLLIFSKQGSFLGAYHKEADIWFRSSEPAEHPPFMLQYLNRGNEIPQSYAFEYHKKIYRPDGQSLIFGYEIGKGQGNVEYRVDLDEGFRSSWSISVSNDSEEPVVEVTFPILGNLTIGDCEKDDILLFPRQLGERISDPVNQMPYNKTDYIGTASMQWMSLFDDQGGIYAGSHDKTMLDTRLEYLGVNQSSMLMFTKQPTIRPGKAWASEPFVIALYDGDWHEAADIYRQWASEWIKPMELPRWLKYSTPRVWGSHINFYAGEHGYGPFHLPDEFEVRHTFSEIPKLWERNLSNQQAQALWTYGQMICGGCYRYYALEPQLGTEEEWIKAVSEVREKGGVVQAYTNAMNFDARFPSNLPDLYRGVIEKSVPDVAEADEWQQWAEENSYRMFDGANRVQYRIPDSPYAVEHRGMCPYTQEWQDYMKYWIVDKYVKEYGNSLMQIDQAGCTFWGTCHNYDHGHEHHGSTTKGYVDLMKTIYEAAVEINPDFVLFPEGIADVMAPYVALQGGQANHWTPAEHKFTHMYRYTFPDHSLRWLFFRDQRDQKYSMLMGLGPIHARTGSREDELYAEIREFYKESLFRDTVGLGSLPEGVTGAVLEHPDNHTVIVMTADRRENLDPYSITLDSEIYQQLDAMDFVYWYPYDNGAARKSVQVSKSNGVVKFNAPSLSSSRSGNYNFGALVFSIKPVQVFSVDVPPEAHINDPFEIRVTVDGKPVEEAQVLIGNRPYTTDASGRISATVDGQPGKYLVRAWKDGLIGSDVIVELRVSGR